MKTGSFRWVHTKGFIHMGSFRRGHSYWYIELESFRWIHIDRVIQMGSSRWVVSYWFKDLFDWSHSDGFNGFLTVWLYSRDSMFGQIFLFWSVQ